MATKVNASFGAGVIAHEKNHLYVQSTMDHDSFISIWDFSLGLQASTEADYLVLPYPEPKLNKESSRSKEAFRLR